MPKICSLIIWFVLFVFQVHAAEISGRVLSSENGKPIENAYVYINGSSKSTLTNAKGEFELKGNFVFPLQLVFQAISFEAKSIKVTTSGPLAADVKMLLKSEELEEISVLAPLKDGWDKYGKLFLDNFLSYSDFSKQCEIVNRKDVEFVYDNANSALYVKTIVPILIKNNALGYIIHFDLKDFSLNFATGEVFYTGYTRYEPMQTKKTKTQSKWDSNRKSAYLGSLMHFVRSITAGEVAQNGYQLNVIVRAPTGEYGERVPVFTDTISTKNSEGMQGFWQHFTTLSNIDTAALIPTVMGFKKWTDSAKIGQVMQMQPPLLGNAINPHKYIVENIAPQRFKIQYFNSNRLPAKDSAQLAKMPEMLSNNDSSVIEDFIAKSRDNIASRSFDYFYTTPYPIDSFLMNEGNQLQLFSQNIIQVMYKLEPEEMPFFNKWRKNKGCDKPGEPKQTPAPQTSNLVFRTKKPIYLMKNGNYYENYDLFIEGYWSYEKLDKMLPLDYEYYAQ